MTDKLNVTAPILDDSNANNSTTFVNPNDTSSISILEMYKAATRASEWGIPGYDIHKKYFDCVKVQKDREFEELKKKGQLPKVKKDKIKKGNYLDDVQKAKKYIPGPDKYKLDFQWVSKEDIEKGKRKSHTVKRCTYIDDIFKESKIKHVPGPGKYNVIKSQDQIKKEIEEMKKKKPNPGVRMNYLMEVEYQSNLTPGPGQYNPRIKEKLNNTKPDYWIQKHKSLEKTSNKNNMPDMGTYKNVFPVEYDTFGKMLSQLKDKKDKPKGNYMGSTERFKDPKKSKSQQVAVPGPGQYPMIASWLGKVEKKDKDKQKKNWMDNITRGVSKSIYY